MLAENVPSALREHYETLSADGLHGDVFLRNAFADALPMGFGAIRIDFPEVPEVQAGQRLTRAEFRARNLRPYWSYVRPENLISWDFSDDGTRFSQVIIKASRTTRRGRFGKGMEPVYHVYEQDENLNITLETWTFEKRDGGGTAKLVPGERKPIRGPSRIPVVPFQLGDPVGPVVARPMLLDLADMNWAHFRVLADRRYLLHVTCVPVPVRKGYRPKVDENGKVLQPIMAIGPNILQDLPADGSFGWAEPQGSAFIPSQQELSDIKSSMAALGLAVLQRDTRQAETAEARRLDGVAQNSTISDAVRRFEDAVELALAVHAEFMGVAVTKSGRSSGGEFSLNREYEDTVLSDSTLSLLSSMQEKNQLTLDTLWQLMERGKLLPDGFSAEKEKAALALVRDTNTDDDDEDDDDSPYKPEPKAA